MSNEENTLFFKTSRPDASKIQKMTNTDLQKDIGTEIEMKVKWKRTEFIISISPISYAFSVPLVVIYLQLTPKCVVQDVDN